MHIRYGSSDVCSADLRKPGRATRWPKPLATCSTPPHGRARRSALGRDPPARERARVRAYNDAMKTADEFTAKWRTTWPEWSIGMEFLPEAQRDTVFAWCALVQQRHDGTQEQNTT